VEGRREGEKRMRGNNKSKKDKGGMIQVDAERKENERRS